MGLGSGLGLGVDRGGGEHLVELGVTREVRRADLGLACLGVGTGLGLGLGLGLGVRVKCYVRVRGSA